MLMFQLYVNGIDTLRPNGMLLVSWKVVFGMKYNILSYLCIIASSKYDKRCWCCCCRHADPHSIYINFIANFFLKLRISTPDRAWKFLILYDERLKYHKDLSKGLIDNFCLLFWLKTLAFRCHSAWECYQSFGLDDVQDFFDAWTSLFIIYRHVSICFYDNQIINLNIITLHINKLKRPLNPMDIYYNSFFWLSHCTENA